MEPLFEVVTDDRLGWPDYWPACSEGVAMRTEIRILDVDDGILLARAAPGVFDGPVDARLSAEFLSDPRHHLAAAVEAGRVVGMASAVHYVHPDKEPEMWINEVGVAPTHRGLGLGGRLLRALLERGRALGCTEAWVLTDRSNEAARRLYAGAGGREAPAETVMFSFPLNSSFPEIATLDLDVRPY